MKTSLRVELGRGGFGRGRRRSRLAALALLAAAACSAAALPSEGLGWLYRRDTTVAGNCRVRVAGPFVERKASGDGATFAAVRPLYSVVNDPAAGRVHRDFLWPVGSSDARGRDFAWRFVVAMGRNEDRANPRSRGHVWILPFLFWGRDAQGRGYFAAFPVGGTIRDFLQMDEIRFAIFPLYSTSRKSRLSTVNYLWPLVSRTTDPRGYRWRVFPFCGRSVREGEFDKRFVLWPFWTSARHERPGARGRIWMLWPLAGRVDMENQKSWLVLPPLIRWSESPGGTQSYAPWPFVQKSSGDVDKLYVWPLYGRKRTAEEDYRFWLWPIFSRRHTSRGEGMLYRRWVAPVYYKERYVPGGDEPVTNATVRVHLWPIFSVERRGEAVSGRVLDLWPASRVPPVERNLAPLWSLYTHRRLGGEMEDEALWGFWNRRRSAAGALRVSLFPVGAWERPGPGAALEAGRFLFGAVSCRRDEAGGRLRWRVLGLGGTGE